MRFFHRKNNRLCAEKEIGFLFTGGTVNFIHPVKAIFVINRSTEPNYKLMVSVSKRNFKNASDRNLLKRRLKEAFRKNTSELSKTLQARGAAVNIAFIYVAKTIVTYKEIETQVVKHISFITNRVDKVD